MALEAVELLEADAGTRAGHGLRQRVATPDGPRRRGGCRDVGSACARSPPGAWVTPRRSYTRSRTGAAEFQPHPLPVRQAGGNGPASTGHSHGATPEEDAARACSAAPLMPRPRAQLRAGRRLSRRRARHLQRTRSGTGGPYLLALRARLELALGRWEAAADSAALVLHDDADCSAAERALTTRGSSARRGQRVGGVGLAEQAHTLVRSTGELERIGLVGRPPSGGSLAAGIAAVEPLTDEALSLALQVWAALGRGRAGGPARWQAAALYEIPAGAAAEPYRLSMADAMRPELRSGGA